MCVAHVFLPILCKAVTEKLKMIKNISTIHKG